VRLIAWPAADVVALAGATVLTGAAGLTGVGAVRGAAYGLLVLLALAAGGLYRRPAAPRATDLTGRLAVAAALPALILAPWLSATRAVALAGCAAVLLVAMRAAAGAALRAAGRRGRLMQHVLVIGTGPAGRQLARIMSEHPELGLAPSGMLNDRDESGPRAGTPANQAAACRGLTCGAPAPVLGRISDAPSVVRRYGIDRVLVCDPAATDADVTEAVRGCRREGATVSIRPRSPELGLAVPRSHLDEIWGVPMITLRPGPLAPARRTMARICDVTIGTVMLAVAAPLIAVLALAVRLDLRLPPLFRQVRVTGRGRRATITKLRTLRPAGDPDTAWLVEDGQCSALGRILRGTHADELPQLASVLRGDMSMVGPRPERPHFARKLRAAIPGYADRERVPAGLTGWAQVHGLSGDTSIADRARFDNFYIEYWSVWLDLLILARTVPAALSGALRSARGGTQ
jgi:lipopolysaccharide/colanic/teichoic acid biosynthesis glycosyltransferase